MEAETVAAEADRRNDDAEAVFTTKSTNGLAAASSSARLGKTPAVPGDFGQDNLMI